MEDLKPMNCHNHHHACPCREELLTDAIEALASIVVGVDKYERTLAPYDKIEFRKFFFAIPSARSILIRARRYT
jgi:hypothetical protein